jgi:hypothetical protein
MNYDIINKTKENLDKLKEALSINELLNSAIDIVDDLTNTKLPGYNKTEKANIDHLINSAVEIIHNLQTAKDQDICFDITNFKKTHTDPTKWTLDKVSELLSILKTNLDKITDTTLLSKKDEILKEIELIKMAINIYNKSGANILSNLTIDTNLINNLVTTTIDIIEKANNNNKNLPLETFITKAIFNALDKKQPIIQSMLPPVNNNQNFTLERLLSKAIFNALDKSQTNSPLVSPSTMTGIVNSGNPSQSMFLNSFLSSNNKYSVILKNTQNGICEDLNKIVSEIAENVCKLITEQFVNTQTGSTSGTGTTKPSGIVSMQKSIPCPNPIPVDYQLLGTYDNTDLRYNDKINTFCTNNSTQPTPPTVIPTINPTPIKSIVGKPPTIAGNPMQSNNLNTLLNIAVDVIDNIKNQNTNIHNLVNAAVDIIVKVKK